MKSYLSSGLALRLLWLVLLLFNLNACKKKQDDNPTPSASMIVGEWKITAVQVSPAQNGTTDALALANSLNGNVCINQVIIGFDPNNKFHLDYSQAQSCYQAKTDYLGYFTGINGQQWSMENNQLVLKDTGQQTQQGQTTTVTTEVARYDVSIKGDQMTWRYQVQRDQQVNPNQTVFTSSDSILMTYTITLQNTWRP